MNALVVYDSKYGNTEQVARAIGSRLKSLGAVRIVSASDSADLDLSGVDLLVIGGPTHGHGASIPLRNWIDGVPSAALRGMAAATFDTRFRIPAFLSGSAARTIAKTLRRNGARLVAKPESFFVSGGEGPLAEGELDRAAAWAEALASKLAAAAVPSDPVHKTS